MGELQSDYPQYIFPVIDKLPNHFILKIIIVIKTRRKRIRKRKSCSLKFKLWYLLQKYFATSKAIELTAKCARSERERERNIYKYF